MRPSKRQADESRPVSIERGIMRQAEGSCLIKCGHTHVLCTASLETRVPPWLRGRSSGWVTAEYGMLPRSTNERMRREATAGRQSGRTVEIQRLIGRSLRAVVDMGKLGERQITIDCDVLQADGGTRTAAITGAALALHDAFAMLADQGKLAMPEITPIAAISAGIVNDSPLLDLDYEEDSQAMADANFVMTNSGQLIEAQATAEGQPISRQHFNKLYDLAELGIQELCRLWENT